MNTSHRAASKRKHDSRSPHLPKFWQPKQPADIQLTCKIIHHDKVEDFRLGRGTVELMWDWVADHLMYSEMVRQLQAQGFEVPEGTAAAMAEQETILDDVIGRYIRIGRVGFSGPELLIAKAAAYAQDAIIGMDRYGIAVHSRDHADQAVERKKQDFARLMLEQGRRVET